MRLDERRVLTNFVDHPTRELDDAPAIETSLEVVVLDEASPHRVAGQEDDDMWTRLERISRAITGRRSAGYERIDLVTRSIPHGDAMAGIDEGSSHGGSHCAESDDRDIVGWIDAISHVWLFLRGVERWITVQRGEDCA